MGMSHCSYDPYKQVHLQEEAKELLSESDVTGTSACTFVSLQGYTHALSFQAQSLHGYRVNAVVQDCHSCTL